MKDNAEGRGDTEWATLMAAAQAGDGVSYARLLRDITPLLRRAAQRRWPTISADDLDDVVQDTLLTLHTVRHTYNASRPFTPWLMAILKHRLLDNARRNFRRSVREVAVANPDETFSHLPANTEEEEKPDREHLHRAIRGLPPRQRLVVELLKLKGLSLKETAQATGMSVIALKMTMHRALKSLRAALGRNQ